MKAFKEAGKPVQDLLKAADGSEPIILVVNEKDDKKDRADLQKNTSPLLSITENIYIVPKEAMTDSQLKDGVYFNPMHNVISPTTSQSTEPPAEDTTVSASSFDSLDNRSDETTVDSGILNGSTIRDLARQSSPNEEFLFTATTTTTSVEPTTITSVEEIVSDELDYEDNGLSPNIVTTATTPFSETTTSSKNTDIKKSKSSSGSTKLSIQDLTRYATFSLEFVGFYSQP